MQQRLAAFREIEAQPVHRSRHEQIEILGEEEARQRGDDVRQHQNRDEGQHDELPGAALRALLTQPLQRRAPLRLEYVRERRLLHRPSTSASSRIWAPPVSFRNSSSRLASPAWCWRRTSLTVPAATTLPCWMMAIWSHIASATSSVCVLISTVPPRPTNCRKMSFRSRAALGSSPTIGSSTTMHSGR